MSTRVGVAVGVESVDGGSISDEEGNLAGLDADDVIVGGHVCSPREARGSELGRTTDGSSTIRCFGGDGTTGVAGAAASGDDHLRRGGGDGADGALRGGGDGGGGGDGALRGGGDGG